MLLYDMTNGHYDTHTDIAFTLHYDTFLCGRGYQRQLKLMSDEGTQGEASIRGEVGPKISLNPIVPLGTSKSPHASECTVSRVMILTHDPMVYLKRVIDGFRKFQAYL